MEHQEIPNLLNGGRGSRFVMKISNIINDQ